MQSNFYKYLYILIKKRRLTRYFSNTRLSYPKMHLFLLIWIAIFGHTYLHKAILFGKKYFCLFNKIISYSANRMDLHFYYCIHIINKDSIYFFIWYRSWGNGNDIGAHYPAASLKISYVFQSFAVSLLITGLHSVVLLSYELYYEYILNRCYKWYAHHLYHWKKPLSFAFCFCIVWDICYYKTNTPWLSSLYFTSIAFHSFVTQAFLHSKAG